jgi:hypothetical protein
LSVTNEAIWDGFSSKGGKAKNFILAKKIFRQDMLRRKKHKDVMLFDKNYRTELSKNKSITIKSIFRFKRKLTLRSRTKRLQMKLQLILFFVKKIN